MTRYATRLVLLAVAVGAFLGLFAAPASAGTYEVRACDAAPGYANNSWAPERNHGGLAIYASCPSGGLDNGLVTRHTGQPAGWTVPTGAAARWVFRAPPATAIVGIRANAFFDQSDHRWQVGLSNGATLLRGCGATRFAIGGACGGGLGEDEYVGVPPSSVLYTETLCAYGPCPASYHPSAPGHVYARAILSSAIVTIDDQSPPAMSNPRGELWTGAWTSGRRSVAFDATDGSGIKASRVFIDDRRLAFTDRACDPTLPSCPDGGAAFSVATWDGVGDGRHALILQAVDRGDNVAESRREIWIDNTPPAAPQGLSVEGGEGWKADNRFKFEWRNPPQAGTAPVSGIEYQLCPSGSAEGCVRDRKEGKNISTLSDLRLPRPGDWTVTAWLRDEAGNAAESTAAAPVHLRFDPDPPELAILSPDPEDPARVRVQAADATSEIARGEVELRRRGSRSWRSLPAVLEAGGFSAVIDDESLARGLYEVRARARDAAGNERSTELLSNGQTALLTLPIRIETRLQVGKAKRVRAARSGRGRTIYLSRPRVRNGRRVRLHGRLTAPGGNPLQRVDVEVAGRPDLPGAAFQPVATLKSSRTGRFTYLVPAGPSRVIRFRYQGAPKIRAQTREIDVRVRASSTVHRSRRSTVNGEAVTFRGRLRGGWVPSTGKLVELQFYGRGEWRTFATTRTDAVGRWRHAYRFTGTRGTIRWRFRARIPRETGYPYAPGKSRRVQVTVRGH